MTTIHYLLESQYKKKTNEVAIFFQKAGQKDRGITYRHLLHQAVSIKKILEKSHVKPGEVVMLIFQHSEELIYTYFGAILHGAVPSIMPFLTEKLDPERYQEDLHSLIDVTQPAAIFTYAEFEHEVRRALGIKESKFSVIVPEFDPTNDEITIDVDRCKPEDVFLLQHSSGTTGLQKGIALSHRAILNQLDSYTKAINICEDDVIVSWLPLYHDMGLIAGFLMPILCGIPLVLMSPFDWVRAPHRLMQAVSDYQGTLVWLPNFAYNFCAQKIRTRHMVNVDLSSWRAVINCSEPMRHESHLLLLEAFRNYGFRGEALATCYAMAENTFAVTQGGINSTVRIDKIDRDMAQEHKIAKPVIGDDSAINMVSAGMPIENTVVKIIDDHGKELTDRHIGEIAVKSNCMLTGYYNRPDITERAFIGGYYLTGDYGYMADNELFITGRKKDLIIVGGKNIYPQDIELMALKVPGVHPGRVVVFGIFSQKAGTEQVILVAETETQDPLEQAKIAKDIRSVVNQGSAVALRKAHIVEKGWIIKTSSGKTARLANRDKFLAETNLSI